MAVDIRANVYCNLGEVISGGWSDDHCQGTGLIRCRGDVVLKGAKSIPVGTRVQLAFTSAVGASQFPRQFRVISCFANAYARTTTLQLGCTLTYLENIKAATDRDRYFYSQETDENKDVPCQMYDVALLPISANSIAGKCMEALGIAGNTGLTNYYAAERFDLQDGYVSVLNDLLFAESKVGYMRDLATLVVVDLAQVPSGAAAASASRIIEMGPIGGGETPADAIAVSYTYKKYKQPDTTNPATPESLWEKVEEIGPPKLVTVEYGIQGNEKQYKAITQDYTLSETTWDKFNRKVHTRTVTRRHLADVNGSYIQKLLSAKETYPSINPVIAPVETIVEEFTDYARAADELEETPEDTAGECIAKKKDSKYFDPDTDDQPIGRRKYTYVSDTEIAGGLPIDAYHFVDPATGAVTVFHPGTAATRLSEYTEVKYDSYRENTVFGDKIRNPDLEITRVRTKSERAKYLVLQGQQLSASETGSFVYVDGTRIQQLIDRMTVMYSDGVTVELTTSPDFGTEKRPDKTALADQRNIKGVKTIEDESVVEFLTGDEKSTNVRVYNLPLAPDDRIEYLGGNYPGSWSITKSDHKEKALKFARAQRRVAFGHTNGVSVQLTAQDMPAYPLDGIAIEGAGITGAFCVDGLSWSFDANGIVCNADCLAWGVLGLTS